MSKLFDELERLEGASKQAAVAQPVDPATTPAPQSAPSKLLAARQPKSKWDEPVFRPRLAEFARTALAPPAEPHKSKTLQGLAFDASMVLIALAIFAGICVALGSANAHDLRLNAPWLVLVPISLAGLYWLLPKVLRQATPGAVLARGETAIAEYAPPTANGRKGPETLSHPTIPLPRPRSARALRHPALEELAMARRILDAEGVLDVHGSVSVRDSHNPNRIFLAGNDIAEYDLNANPAAGDPSQAHPERFLHCEIYRARPDVMAIVHSQAPELIPFAASSVPLLPVLEMADFLVSGVPVFESRRVGEVTDAGMRARALGQAVAETLGDRAAVLMRGRGAVIVGPSLPVAAGRAYYMNLNARLQAQSILLGGTVNYLEPSDSLTPAAEFERAWAYWKQKSSV